MDRLRPTPAQPATPFARLRQLARPVSAVQERCELCGADIPGEHQHLMQLANRQMQCACDACAILFSSDNTLRYRRVPRRVWSLGSFELSDATWDSLHVPINMAFFYRITAEDNVLAIYPSPAGATESHVPLDAWNDLVAENPELGTMQNDVEAVLINRIGKRRDSLIVPIDQCYRLVGIVRSHWRGLSGGAEVWREVDKFFDQLNRLSSPAKGSVRA